MGFRDIFVILICHILVWDVGCKPRRAVQTLSFADSTSVFAYKTSGSYQAMKGSEPDLIGLIDNAILNSQAQLSSGDFRIYAVDPQNPNDKLAVGEIRNIGVQNKRLKFYYGLKKDPSFMIHVATDFRPQSKEVLIRMKSYRHIQDQNVLKVLPANYFAKYELTHMNPTTLTKRIESEAEEFHSFTAEVYSYANLSETEGAKPRLRMREIIVLGIMLSAFVTEKLIFHLTRTGHIQRLGGRRMTLATGIIMMVCLAIIVVGTLGIGKDDHKPFGMDINILKEKLMQEFV